jgi:two-component system phosphate regulon sensor histidine kinase PhoR
MNEILLLVVILLTISLAALGGHNLRLRRERSELQWSLRRVLDAGSAKQAEVERQVAWYRAACQLSPDAILITNTDKEIVAENGTAVAFFGKGKAGDALIQRVREHHLERLLDKALQAKAVPPTLVELPERQVQARVATWQSTPEEEGGAVLYVRDVTELNRLMRARRDMVANISHELRTPLASIKLIAGTLLDGAIDEPGMNRKLVNRVATENEALIRLVEDLTALNFIETGRMPLHLEKTDLRVLVEQRLQRLQPQMELKEMRYRVLGEESAIVDLDSERFGQVLTNIFDNAIKFSPMKSRLTATLSRADSTTVLEITDEGPGIMPHDLPRIFERFYKGDRSRTRTGGGTGLGLAIAKHLVEGHGGMITARNNDITGATFRIELPD